MVTRKTVVTTIRESGEGFSKSLDALFDKGKETLDAGMKVLDEAMKSIDPDPAETFEVVSTTIRIRLTPQQVIDLQQGCMLTFSGGGTTILVEVKA